MQIEEHQMLSGYIQPNEALQWTGRPSGGFLLRRSDAIMIPFSLVWGGFALFWEYSAYASGAPLFFLLFGGVFVIVGLYIMIGRFWFDMLKRGRTIYGLTNERALILTGVFGQSLISVNLKSIPEISLQLKSDGRGTITFGSAAGFQSMFYNSSWPGSARVAPSSFDLIENAAQVYQMIQTIQSK